MSNLFSKLNIISVSKENNEFIEETVDLIKLPTDEVKFSISIGAATYEGQEKNYSELFKKADIALYQTKANRKIHYAIYQENE